MTVVMMRKGLRRTFVVARVGRQGGAWRVVLVPSTDRRPSSHRRRTYTGREGGAWWVVGGEWAGGVVAGPWLACTETKGGIRGLKTRPRRRGR